MQIREKRSSESVLYDIDCSLLLAAGETVTSVTSVACDEVTVPPLSFGTASVNVSPQTYTDSFGSVRTAPVGQVVQVLIGGGKIAPGRQVQLYTVRCKVVTSRNNPGPVEATVLLRVNDTPRP